MSIVKSALHPNCSDEARRENKTITPNNSSFCTWKPFDTDNYNIIFCYLDSAYLLSYAVGMFMSGHLADRVNLRFFLTGGCLACGLTTAAFGMGYFLNIHSLLFYVFVQIIGGFSQSTGWPSLVACMGNWFGKSRRGLIFGLWNAHTSFGNIIGGFLASYFVDYAWGWSFVLPGLIIYLMGIVVFLFLVPHPKDISGTLYLSQEIIPSGENDINMEDEYNEEADVLLDTPRAPLLSSHLDCQPNAVPFIDALRVPGTIEYSLCLFFNKLVSYTFLFWLPWYIHDVHDFPASLSANLSLIFDLGGIIGGILAGAISDKASASAILCVSMIAASIPILYVFYFVGASTIACSAVWLFFMGLFVNGPYTLITTVISTDLGQHHSLVGNVRALATMSAILDGTGSIGATVGPLICGLLIVYGWFYVFSFLMISSAIAALMLLRRFVDEFTRLCVHIFYDNSHPLTVDN